MIKLYKSFLLSLVFILSFNTTSNARDVNLSMWTHNTAVLLFIMPQTVQQNKELSV